MPLQRPTLETPRLILRPFDLSDAADLMRLVGDPAIADTTLNIPHPYKPGMAEAWIGTHAERFEKAELVNFAICLREDGQLIGSIGLSFEKTHRRAEPGWWIARDLWGKGYCTEAAGAVIGYAFSQRVVNRIVAYHFLRNPGSGRVLQKLGMKQEGLLRQHVRKADRFEDLCSGASGMPAAGEMGDYSAKINRGPKGRNDCSQGREPPVSNAVYLSPGGATQRCFRTACRPFGALVKDRPQPGVPLRFTPGYNRFGPSGLPCPAQSIATLSRQMTRWRKHSSSEFAQEPRNSLEGKTTKTRKIYRPKFGRVAWSLSLA